MEEVQNGGLLVETVAIGTSGQETFDSGSGRGRLAPLSEEELTERLSSLLGSVRRALGDVASMGAWQAKEITIKVGVDVEGRFFIASGKASTAVEVTFTP